MRRLRKNATIRRWVRQTRLTVDQLVYPLFVQWKPKGRQAIASLPGQFRYSLDQVAKEAKAVYALGISAILLFGIPKTKEEAGSEAYDDEGIVQEAVRAIRKAVPDLLVITDVCLCEYTRHGHCGWVDSSGVEVRIDNDRSLELLSRIAVSHAKAGAHMVAPSDMMDGRVRAIREGLDQEGFTDVAILSYAAKFCSSFYGPFREAVHSSPQFGDRRTYQMDPANSREALREMELDLKEGADLLMVKPALPYLDIIALARQRFHVPIVAYQVSGEYAMIKTLAKDAEEERSLALETLTSIHRAGADILITYFAKALAPHLYRLRH
jgi:porphobilinogen synthase